MKTCNTCAHYDVCRSWTLPQYRCGMIFKEFEEWCNERAGDGCWPKKTAMFCIEVIRNVRRESFLNRERAWQALNKMGKIEETIVRPINVKIEELEKGGAE